MKKYTLGLDFGTLSLRIVVVDIENGNVVGTHVENYPHGVMDLYLKKNENLLPKDYALQDGMDYIYCLEKAMPIAIENSKVNPKDIIGIGVDFTACTMLPMKKDGTLLSSLPQFENEPFAYVKLWKHHGAEKLAKTISELAHETNEQWIARYGGKISSEWMLPKLLETYRGNKDIFDEADYFIEAGDYITYYLTGILKRSSCQAGYKNIWHAENGFVSKEFLSRLSDDLTNLYDTKLSGDVMPIGKSQGRIKGDLANKFNLNENVEVGVSIIDAHVAAPACKVVNSSEMLMIMGTSSCDIILHEKEIMVKGISGVVKDGAVPDLFAYESGQAAVGDIYAWFMDHMIPKEYKDEATQKGISIYALMEEKVRSIPANKNRILALDWWNGNRSILIDPNLTGVLIGMDLRTKPEEIYRALIEATAFGKKKIIDTYENAGINIEKLVACGGLATKNNYLMQVYADIIGRPIYITSCEQAPALGAAIFGAIAAGKLNGGYDDINEASEKMGQLKEEPIRPNSDTKGIYDSLYKLYEEVHDYFGIDSDLMKKLRSL